MDTPTVPNTSHEATDAGIASRPRTQSLSQQSDNSQTAADFIRDQLQLEADAREALPYSIENCTKPLGSLRQNVFACLTCNPPPANPSDSYNPAGVCYSCSVQCHGEHELVEIFQKRDFTCDCGTTRFSPEQKCSLRINSETNTKGGVHSERPDPNNKYNQNFRNRFCSCSIDYKPHEQKGTMFQCLGLGTHETGGCGEDWYHPGCLVGLGPKWYEKKIEHISNKNVNGNSTLPTISEDTTLQGSTNQQVDGIQGGEEEHAVDDDDDDAPLPEGFPTEDAFDHFLCYKCVEAHPWIKRYAGTPGFLPAVFLQKEEDATAPKKRKLEDDGSSESSERSKRIKSEPEATADAEAEVKAVPPIPESKDTTPQVKEDEKKKEIISADGCKLASLPLAPIGKFSLFATSDFRDRFCRCASCFSDLNCHPQLLEEEEAYEPPLSDSGSEGGSTHGSGSLYDRGESALRNVDRVRAIEGVMAYNHLKERLKPFFQQFAESGKAIGAEDIKEYFAKLRGDEQAIKDAGEAARDDHRQEQSGY
ncbi:putative zinc finger in N-recognin-domain-containing protein [Annulohypoxylon maeteangense]|uniref:putative zinc finger in N-recognin-domain-containing protein n=1 Tax=Annulohypoxylon maeteangense TaxID=1927788 RepID=UPI00200862DE|nr:putative zinc finger in N-recognin-domain-containing protein [Annulohypoxylon maeteangense]KAI0880623.1 putative zinc finger in N-recognin-domain-containing protein [Annulohypoxylon maeteangense]